MLSDYITKMYEENENKLNSLQREMDEIVTDINNAQTMMERLQYEKKLDTNIFSPRKINAKADEKINECRIKIKGMKQRMEYVSQMVEECLNNRNELTVLLKEAQEKGQTDPENNKSLRNISDNSITDQTENMSEILTVDRIETISEISIVDQTEDQSGVSIVDQTEDQPGVSIVDQTEDQPGVLIVGQTEDMPGVSLNGKMENIAGVSLNSKLEDLRDTSLNGGTEDFSDLSLDSKLKDESGTPSKSRLIEISEMVPDDSSDRNTESNTQDYIEDRVEDHLKDKIEGRIEDLSKDKIEDRIKDRIEHGEKNRIGDRTEDAVNIVQEVSDEKTKKPNTFPELEELGVISAPEMDEPGALSAPEIDEPGTISALNLEYAQIQKEKEFKKNLLTFLNELYKHNEIALALVNGNKNKCKSEIRNSMSMIREYAKKVENGD